MNVVMSSLKHNSQLIERARQKVGPDLSVECYF